MIHVIIDLFESAKLCVPSSACFASESCSQYIAVFHNHCTNEGMWFSIIFRDALSSFRYCQVAEFPIQDRLGKLGSGFR